MLHPQKDETGKIQQVSGCDAFMHFLSIGWKVLFSIVPPAHMMGGWACFFVALIMICLLMLVVVEVANLLSCVLGLHPALNAACFVAIGASIPDLMASRHAAEKERYADAAIGNITGSNSVNVFLGMGISWMIGSIYYYNNDITNGPEGGVYAPGEWHVARDPMITAIITYLILSVITFVILILRRIVVKGELGGSNCGRFTSALLLFVLWFVYVVIVGLKAYEMI